MKKYLSYDLRGKKKILGYITGNTYALVRSKKTHFIKALQGYGIPAPIIEQLKVREVSQILIIEKDKDTGYRVDLSLYLKAGITKGSHSGIKQIILPIEYYEKIR